MPVSISDPRLTIKNLLKTAWIPGNVSGITPAFHTGFINPGGDQYQICFPELSEGSPTASGFDAIASDGPVKRMIGVVPVMLFARREATKSQHSLNPKKFLYQARVEVERLIHNNVLALSDFEYLSVVSSASQPPDPDQAAPPFFGWTIGVQYMWRKTLT